MANRKWEREHIGVLLAAYKLHPFLYVTKSRDYYDRTKRDLALEQIAAEVSKYRPQTTVNEVKTKIKTLRNQYAAEKAAIVRSGEDILEPRLWCYDSLKFLEGHVKPRLHFGPGAGNGYSGDASDQCSEDPPFSEIDGDASKEFPGYGFHYIKPERTEFVEELIRRVETPCGDIIDSDISSASHLNTVRFTKRSNNNNNSNSGGGVTNNKTLIVDDAANSVNFVRFVRSSNNEDQHDIFGKYVASEIRQITDLEIYFQTKRAIQNAIADGQERMLVGRTAGNRHPFHRGSTHKARMESCDSDSFENIPLASPTVPMVVYAPH